MYVFFLIIRKNAIGCRLKRTQWYPKPSLFCSESFINPFLVALQQPKQYPWRKEIRINPVSACLEDFALSASSRRV